MLTEQGMLLPPIVRDAISCVLGVPYKTTAMVVNENAPWLAKHGACFVTLTQFGQLRGCIGTLEAYRSLLTDFKSNAVPAALHVPRFLPLTREEFTVVRVEVSLLTTPQPLGFASEKGALEQLHPGSVGSCIRVWSTLQHISTTGMGEPEATATVPRWTETQGGVTR